MNEDEENKARTKIINRLKDIGITLEYGEFTYMVVSESPDCPDVWFVIIDGKLRVQKTLAIK